MAEQTQRRTSGRHSQTNQDIFQTKSPPATRLGHFQKIHLQASHLT